MYVALGAEADDAATEYVHDHQHPVTTQQDRFTAEQIEAPEAVLRLRDEGQPGRSVGAGVVGPVVLGEHAAELNNVAGLRSAATLSIRRRLTNRVVKPSTKRSRVVRFGARCLDRLLIRSCCLRSRDSAATARTPPRSRSNIGFARCALAQPEKPQDKEDDDDYADDIDDVVHGITFCVVEIN